MQFLSRRLTLSTLAVCALGAFSAFGALAQDYPNKPIRIIAPFPTGTGPDANTREIAQELSKVLGQTMVVENHGGGGGDAGAFFTGALAVPAGGRRPKAASGQGPFLRLPRAPSEKGLQHDIGAGLAAGVLFEAGCV